MIERETVTAKDVKGAIDIIKFGLLPDGITCQSNGLIFNDMDDEDKVTFRRLQDEMCELITRVIDKQDVPEVAEITPETMKVVLDALSKILDQVKK